MRRGTLRRRIEVLERVKRKVATAVDNAEGQARIQNALERLSMPDLELLISGSLAALRGQDLTEPEQRAKHAYYAALRDSGRGTPMTTPGLPNAQTAIAHAAFRMAADEDLRLTAAGCRAMLQGIPPSESERAAMGRCEAMLEAQYQRAGFKSQREFEAQCGRSNQPLRAS